MAQDRNSGFLTVHWLKGDSMGAIDYLPWVWFTRDVDRHDLKHEFLGTDGKIYPARCSVAVSGKIAILDYDGKYADANEENGCDVGQLKIVFDGGRKEPKRLWWKVEGGDFERAVVRCGGDGEDLEAQEGGPKLVAHLRRERSLRMRAAKVKEVLEQHGELRCEACNFSFEENYGKIAAKYCEVHHRKGLAATGKTVTRTKDLAVLCSNCHRIIHLTKPMMSVEKFAKQHVGRRSQAG